MKKFTFKAVATLLMVVAFTSLNAQVKPGVENSKTIRCGTMEALEQMLKKDPTLAAKWKADGDRIFNQSLSNQNRLNGTSTSNGTNGPNSPTGTTAITYIPVVLHVIGTAAQQAILTDAILQRQIDVLNRDFGGLNPDSSKLPPTFYALFGHSELRFVLAKRTPAGAATNGIERLTSAITFTAGTYNTVMKHTAAGGLDQWDGNKYFNIWVGTFTDGLLGIATFPNTGNANEQGVCIHWGSVDLPCGSPFNGVYDGGRSLVHEAGHYFYLFHIWGDDGTACTGSDWGTPYGALSATCLDDTPNQAGATAGCLSGVRTDACSPNPPGFMYQNYMDYTDDACYGMFTMGQVCRAQSCVDLYRAGLKTSDGATPVGAGTANDARVSEILNPASRGFACASNTNFCNAFSPQVMIVNDGDAPLTSLAIDSKVDGISTGTPTNWTGNLAPGAFAFVNLNTVNSTSGVHVLTVKSSLPNGAADARPASDSVNARFTMTTSAATNFPIPAEGFEGGTFPPAGFTVINPNVGSITWSRTTAAARTGSASALVGYYLYNSPGQIDILASQKLNTSASDIVNVEFDLAYAPFSATLFERLEVVYSTDCGATWLPTGYDKSGLTLGTAGGFVTASFIPTAAQWRHESVSILLGCGPVTPAVVIGLRGTCGYGNQLYIDNLAITSVGPAANNLAANTLTGIPAVVCPTVGLNGVITPTFSFRNLGATAVTTARIMAKIDALPATQVGTFTGSLAKCNVATVALAPITITTGGGNHTIKVYTDLPNGTPDLVPVNDTLSQTFYVQEGLTVPYTQGFETATFPPAGGWRVSNPDGGITWARTTVAARTGAASMFMNFYAYAGAGQEDIISTPIVPLTGLDSLTLSFDYAYAPFSAALNDTLEIMYSRDCGTTWLPTGWRKGGVQLATNGGAFVTASFTPTAAQWKTETIQLATCNVAAPNVMYGFKAKNGYGNQLYVDNFSITGVTSLVRNAGTVSISEPPYMACTAGSSATFAPKATIGNYGSDTLKSITINFSVDGGTPVTTAWTGSLAKCATALVTLNSVTIPGGYHNIAVYTSNFNNTVLTPADQYTKNDTIRSGVFIATTVATPQTEGFEGAAFPPGVWGIHNPDGLVTWSKSSAAGSRSASSMVIKNFDYTVGNTRDEFISPIIINNASIDSQFVSFDYAYVQGNQYPGSTVRPLDTLELMITQDCGVTFKTIWKNWGDQLQTVSDPNYVYTAAYTPSTNGEWKNVKLFLNPFVGTSNYQVFWVAKSNRQNNLYIDNINISSKTLPLKLKNQGYDIYPNPFSSSFRIHHWQAPVDLQAAQVYTSAGQLVWEKRYSGNANTEINVDMSRLASGVYVLKMIYTNKTVVEKIVKN